MLKKIRPHLSSAHVLAAVALFVALGGTALAVKKGTIGTQQLKKEAVTTKKIADDAVIGAKVDESTLGTVPNADKAGSATTSDLAAKATNADAAANASALQGRTLTQVRGGADGNTSSSDTPLPVLGGASVITEDIEIPSGGAGLVASATVQVVNGAASSRLASCELRDASGAIGQLYSVRLDGGGDSDTLSLTAFEKVANTGTLSTSVDVTLLCSSANGSEGDVNALNADLVLQQVPTG